MSEILYDTKFLQLKSTPSKSGKPWVYAHRPNATDVVVILPVANDEILFLTEERPPLQAEGKGKYSIALPAGLVGDVREGETTEDAIKAELLEEAGLIAKKIEIKSRKIASSPGCVSETITLAIAYLDSKIPVKGVLYEIFYNSFDLESVSKNTDVTFQNEINFVSCFYCNWSHFFNDFFNKGLEHYVLFV